MKYYEEKNGDKFIENGNSKVRVGLVTLKPSPLQEGRTLKVFEVVEVIRHNEANPIIVGHHLAMSFPNEKLHVKFYEWNKTNAWEESQVPMRLNTGFKAKTREVEVKRN